MSNVIFMHLSRHQIKHMEGLGWSMTTNKISRPDEIKSLKFVESNNYFENKELL